MTTDTVEKPEDIEPASPELPAHLRRAADNLILAAAHEKYVLIGVLFRAEPVPSVALLMDTADDPVDLLRAATELIDARKANIKMEKVQPVN